MSRRWWLPSRGRTNRRCLRLRKQQAVRPVLVGGGRCLRQGLGCRRTPLGESTVREDLVRREQDHPGPGQGDSGCAGVGDVVVASCAEHHGAAPQVPQRADLPQGGGTTSTCTKVASVGLLGGWRPRGGGDEGVGTKNGTSRGRRVSTSGGGSRASCLRPVRWRRAMASWIQGGVRREDRGGRRLWSLSRIWWTGTRRIS